MHKILFLKSLSHQKVLLYFITLVFLAGCTHPSGELKLFTLISSSKTNITFSNTLEENGTLNIIEYMYYYDGGGVAAGDINNDGLPDLVLGGNFNAISANFGIYDARYGLPLKGNENGKGAFRPLKPGESGWVMKGEVRDIQKIKLADGGTLVLVDRNNEKIKLFGLLVKKTINNTTY